MALIAKSKNKKSRLIWSTASLPCVCGRDDRSVGWVGIGRARACAGCPASARTPKVCPANGGWMMGVRDGRAAPDYGTNRNLTWQFAKDSEVWFCHLGKWQITMDDPATIFVTIWLLYCFSFVQSALFGGHFLSCIYYFHFHFQLVQVQAIFACLSFTCAWRGGNCHESLC